jgi:hypothetical protein
VTQNKLDCNEPYHLLVIDAPDASIGETADLLWLHNLFTSEGPDFMLRLYTEASMVAADAEIYRMSEQPTGPRCAEPIAQSGIFALCDYGGKHVEPGGGGAKNCTGFSRIQYWDNPSLSNYTATTKCNPEPVVPSSGGFRGTNIGLIVGPSVGLGVGLILVVGVAVWWRRKNKRNEAPIQKNEESQTNTTINTTLLSSKTVYH